MRVAGIFLFAAMLLRGQQPQMAFLHGTVLDPSGAVFPGMTVEVFSQQQTCKTKTNQDGRFNCQLPPGRYRVVVVNENLMPYRRATVNLQPSVHVFLNLRPVLRGAPISVDSVTPVKTDFPDPKIGYEEQTIGANTDVLVQYFSSTMQDKQIAFRGPHLALTIDALSVYADELLCSNPIRTCTAKGSVIAEVGSDQLEGTALDLDLLTRRLVLSRDPNVVRTF